MGPFARKRIAVGVGEHEPCAHPLEQSRRRQTDTARGAGHHNALAIQIWRHDRTIRARHQCTIGRPATGLVKYGMFVLRRPPR